MTRELLEDLDPQSALERELSDRIVGICWRRRRLWRAEEEIIARQFGEVGGDGVRIMPASNQGENERDENESNAQAAARIAGQGFLAEQFERPEGTPLLRLAQHERRLNGAMDSALRLLLKLQDRRERREDLAELPAQPTVALASLLTAAQRAERSPDRPAAQNKPNKNAKTSASSPASSPTTSPVQNKPIGNAPTPIRAPAQNKANALSPDPLGAARRGELPPVPRVAPAQNKAIAAPKSAARQDGAHQMRTLAPAQNKAIAAAAAATAVEAGWVGTIAQVPAFGGVCEPPAVHSSAPVAAA